MAASHNTSADPPAAGRSMPQAGAGSLQRLPMAV